MVRPFSRGGNLPIPSKADLLRSSRSVSAATTFRMAPKKGKKITLNEFLGDSTLGSWADEMDALPSAPAARNEDDSQRPTDRYGRREEASLRMDRPVQPPREDIPLPTQPPYTAFVGNLAFDLTESQLESYFAPSKAKSVKIIRDRDDRPKGFGYIEFEDLQGLKEGLLKTGSAFAGRTIRVSVAEPPKERPTLHGAASHIQEDDSKFDSPWRRDGPLPDVSIPRKHFDPSGERERPRPLSVSEGISDWRSNSRPPRTSFVDSLSTQETAGIRRKGSEFSTPDSQGQADKEEVWSKGSKYIPSTSEENIRGDKEKLGSMRGRNDFGISHQRDMLSHSVVDEGDWRSKAQPRSATKGSTSPNSSTPPTPQMGRKKLELLPRSGGASASPSPLSSPKMSSVSATTPSSARSNPFGSARPVDVSTREKEVTERLDREREANKEKLTMSRTNSRSASTRTAPSAASQSSPLTTTPAVLPHKPVAKISAPNVRPSLSFANVAANKEKIDQGQATAGSNSTVTEGPVEVV